METEHKSRIRQLALMIVDELDSAEGMSPEVRMFCGNVIHSICELFLDYEVKKLQESYTGITIPSFRDGIL